MYKYILVLVILLAVSCGGGSPVNDPPDPPVKTLGGDWLLTARGDVPDSWPEDVQIYMHSEPDNRWGLLTLPPAISESLNDDVMEFRKRSHPVIANTQVYNSDRIFSAYDDPHLYGQWTFIKSGNGDYLTLKFPDGDGGAVVVVYDAVKQ